MPFGKIKSVVIVPNEPGLKPFDQNTRFKTIQCREQFLAKKVRQILGYFSFLVVYLSFCLPALIFALSYFVGSVNSSLTENLRFRKRGN